MTKPERPRIWKHCVFMLGECPEDLAIRKVIGEIKTTARRAKVIPSGVHLPDTAQNGVASRFGVHGGLPYRILSQFDASAGQTAVRVDAMAEL